MVKSLNAARTTRRVPFRVSAPEAKEVRITGDFIGWITNGVGLSKNGNGEWRTVLTLAPGEYQYRLLIDGEWQDHREASRRLPNPFGTENCVLKVE
jgi:1,4-alpha-glucan branching enzyme